MKIWEDKYIELHFFIKAKKKSKKVFRAIEMSKILTTLSPAVEADLPMLAQINTAADQDQAIVFLFFFQDSSPAALLQFFLHRLTANSTIRPLRSSRRRM